MAKLWHSRQRKRKRATAPNSETARIGKETGPRKSGLPYGQSSKELGLNKSQTMKLQVLNLKQMQEREAVHPHYKNGEKRDRNQRQEMKASREKWDAELKDILTKKQYAQHQEQRNEMPAQQQERKG